MRFEDLPAEAFAQIAGGDGDDEANGLDAVGEQTIPMSSADFPPEVLTGVSTGEPAPSLADRPERTPPVKAPPRRRGPAQQTASDTAGHRLSAGSMVLTIVGAIMGTVALGYLVVRVVADDGDPPGASAERSAGAREQATNESLPPVDPTTPPAPRPTKDVEPTRSDARPSAGSQGVPDAVPPTEDVRAFIQRARRARRGGDADRAERVLRAGLERHPETGPLAYRLALVLRGRDQPDAALEWARRATEWSPTQPRYWSLLGDLHLELGQGLDARRALQRCLEIRPGLDSCRVQLDRLEQRWGRSASTD